MAMIIKRQKLYTDPVQQGTAYIGDSANYLVGTTEGALDYVDNTTIGQVPQVRRKTGMVRNAISGIRAYLLPRKKKKHKTKE